MKKYMTILSDIKSKIKTGYFHPGQKLPSVRSAAKLYGCSISTVLRAYTELEKRHDVYVISQSGFYVVEHSESHNQCHKEDEQIDFASASPDAALFPYLDFQHCLNKAIDTYKSQLFTYGDPRGMDKLRTTMVSHLANDQVFAKQEQIMITSGVQQALQMLARIPFPNGNDVILVEQPSYDIFLRFLENEGLPVCGIARSANGIDLQLLEHKFKNDKIKFFYTMTRYHNPLGTSFSTAERQAIAKLAGKYDVFIVEDDYMADLGGVEKSDPIYAYNSSSHVIYLKSFSKIMFPGLRLGVMVIPQSLLDTIHAYQSYADTSLLSQAALDVYIKNGMYDRHKHEITSHYAARLHALREAIIRYNQAGLIEVPEVFSGMYAQLKCPQTVNMERLMRQLAKRKVSAVSGKQFYLTNYLAREKFLRLSISRAPLETIDKGVKMIIEEASRANW